MIGEKETLRLTIEQAKAIIQLYSGCRNALNLSKELNRTDVMFILLTKIKVYSYVEGLDNTSLFYIAFGGLKTGVIAGAGVLVVGLIVWNINNSSRVQVENTTKTLPDVKAKQPTGKPYKLAYVNDKNELIKYGKSLSLKEVLILLGFAKATDSMYQSYKYDNGSSSEAQRKVQPLGKGKNYWGVYAKTQSDAKVLATILGVTDPPEVHGSGMYGHYNSRNKVEDSPHFHIWFGGVLTY